MLGVRQAGALVASILVALHQVYPSSVHNLLVVNKQILYKRQPPLAVSIADVIRTLSGLECGWPQETDSAGRK